MDEGFITQELSDTFWLEELREYGVVDHKESRSIARSSNTSKSGVTFSSGAARLQEVSLPKAKMGITSPSLDVHHASPLAPLRERDSQALDAFFDSDRIQEITLDIHRYLARMYPEPCWEDEPYEFLRGYI